AAIFFKIMPGEALLSDINHDLIRFYKTVSRHPALVYKQFVQYPRSRDIFYELTALPQVRMTVDEFLAWARDQPGRYELHNGMVFAPSPDGIAHAKAKFAVQTALANGIRARGLPCHMLPDGLIVRVEPTKAYEPDALVYCGPELPPSA